MTVKVDKNGKIKIPKHIRQKFNFSHGVALNVSVSDGRVVLTPEIRCSRCGKALTSEFAERGACMDCTPIKTEKVIVY